MTWMKVVYIGFACGIMFILGISIGRISIKESAGHLPGRNHADLRAALIQPMHDKQRLHFSGQGSDISIARSKDLLIITGVGVYNPDKCTTHLGFHNTGEISGITIRLHGRYVRNWSFLRNGAIESETVFPSDKPSGMGTQTFFKLDGSIERTEQVHYHGS